MRFAPLATVVLSLVSSSALADEVFPRIDGKLVNLSNAPSGGLTLAINWSTTCALYGDDAGTVEVSIGKDGGFTIPAISSKCGQLVNGPVTSHANVTIRSAECSSSGPGAVSSTCFISPNVAAFHSAKTYVAAMRGLNLYMLPAHDAQVIVKSDRAGIAASDFRELGPEYARSRNSLVSLKRTIVIEQLAADGTLLSLSSFDVLGGVLPSGEFDPLPGAETGFHSPAILFALPTGYPVTASVDVTWELSAADGGLGFKTVTVGGQQLHLGRRMALPPAMTRIEL